MGSDAGNLEIFASINLIAQIPERILFRKEHNVIMSEQCGIRKKQKIKLSLLSSLSLRRCSTVGEKREQGFLRIP